MTNIYPKAVIETIKTHITQRLDKLEENVHLLFRLHDKCPYVEKVRNEILDLREHPKGRLITPRNSASGINDEVNTTNTYLEGADDTNRIEMKATQSEKGEIIICMNLSDRILNVDKKE